jgi:hypothetical protein
MLVTVVSACGGGTDGTGGVPPTEAVTSSGSMTRGSVILNGTRFDDSAVVVTDDRNRTAAELANGMVIKLRGRSDDGVTGVADRIDVENEVRGAIESIDATASPRRFTVAGLAVIVDSQTIFADVADFDALTVGLRVEVHGLRDANGLIHATRVEAVGARGLDERRGSVAHLETALDRFTLDGGLAVSYAGATFQPAGASEADLAQGRIVEVRGTLVGSVFTAIQIDIEDLEDEAFRGGVGEKQEVEGFVSGFTLHPGAFQVNGRDVRTTPNTRFVGGAAVDLDNGAEVEAEGSIDAQGVLVAATIKFKRTRVVLHGLATSVNAAARRLVVLNQTANANDLTRVIARAGAGASSDQLADITAGIDCVEVRGYLDGFEFVAEWIREPVSCTRDVAQARVLGKDEANATLTLFADLIASLPPGAQYLDANEAPITRAAFLSAITAAGTGHAGSLVKVRGTLVGTTLVAEEAELKN